MRQRTLDRALPRIPGFIAVTSLGRSQAATKYVRIDCIVGISDMFDTHDRNNNGIIGTILHTAYNETITLQRIPLLDVVRMIRQEVENMAADRIAEAVDIAEGCADAADDADEDTADDEEPDEE